MGGGKCRPSAHEPDEDTCVVARDKVESKLRLQCVGRVECTIDSTVEVFERLECAKGARGWERPHLVATLVCQKV
jgi:hypothetical protein